MHLHGWHVSSEIDVIYENTITCINPYLRTLSSTHKGEIIGVALVLSRRIVTLANRDMCSKLLGLRKKFRR